MSFFYYGSHYDYVGLVFYICLYSLGGGVGVGSRIRLKFAESGREKCACMS